MTRFEIPMRLVRPDDMRLGREKSELLPEIAEWCADNLTGSIGVAIVRETHGTGRVGSFSITLYAEFESDVDAVAFKMVWL